MKQSLLGVVLLLLSLSCSTKNLYDILDVAKTASVEEIKRAYRKKARDTHPDKVKGDPVEASERFREVVNAFEILSDKASRERFDKTGKTGFASEQQQTQQNSWNWNQQRWNWNQGSGIRQHPFLFDRFRRLQIIDAQTRTLKVNPNFQHLLSVAHDSADESSNNERYVLIAFYDSSLPACENKMNLELLFPWPFAGYTSDATQGGIWWDEFVIPLKMDLRSGKVEDLAFLSNYFGLDLTPKLKEKNCPSVVLVPRGEKMSPGAHRATHFSSHEEFSSWVWQQLKMTVVVENKTPWVLHYWWLDGLRGKRQEDIAPGADVKISTFISHTFFFRADLVQGHVLTNESALLWYNARIQDHGTKIQIHPRCFDHHGDCVRWRQEGFCDRSSHTFYTAQNPGFFDFASRECPVSCATGCGRKPPVEPRNRNHDHGQQREEL